MKLKDLITTQVVLKIGSLTSGQIGQLKDHADTAIADFRSWQRQQDELVTLAERSVLRPVVVSRKDSNLYFSIYWERLDLYNRHRWKGNWVPNQIRIKREEDMFAYRDRVLLAHACRWERDEVLKLEALFAAIRHAYDALCKAREQAGRLSRALMQEDDVEFGTPPVDGSCSDNDSGGDDDPSAA